MTRNSGKVHVVSVRKTGYADKQGRERDYSSAYLRRTYREAGTVKNQTVANISVLPDHVIDLIDAGLKGQQLVPAAQAKASCQYDQAGRPYRTFRGLLEHLATVPRNQVRFAGTQVTVPMLTEPTSAQREAFTLLGTPIPLTLT